MTRRRPWASTSLERLSLLEMGNQMRLAERTPHSVAVNASAYFSRPGPRLIDGVELLAHVLHPERVRAPAGAVALEVSLASGAASECRGGAEGDGEARAGEALRIRG